VGWQTFFEKDRNILILCICLSAIIWIFNRMSQLTRSTLDVQVKVEVPRFFVVSEAPSRTLRVGIEGTGWQLLQLIRQEKIDIQLNPVRSTDPQQWSSDQLRLRLSDLSTFKDVRIVSINPARINVLLDSAAVKSVPVVLPYKLDYAKGYSNIEPLDISPKEVQVSGPKSKIAQLQSWKLDSLIATDIRKNIMDSIPFSQSINYEKVYSLSPSYLKYELPVSEFTELKQVCKIESPADSISLFPRRAVVRIRVPTDKYNAAQNYDIRLSIQIDNKSDGSNVPIQVKNTLPYWMKNIRISPPTVDYLIPDSLVVQ